MKKQTVSLVLLTSLLYPGARVALAQIPPVMSSAEDVVVIDGAKHPEQVPEWAAWLEAFRFMSAPAAPIEPIPTIIYDVTTPEDRALVRKESMQVIAREKAVYDRALKLLDGLTAENTAERTRQLDAIEVERHTISIEARDRLLAALPAAAQTALRAFVDETRKGFRAYVPKSKMTQFRSPE
jgi:hypothetical protein